MEQLTQQLQAESRQKEEVRSEVQGRQALLDRKSTTIADLQATLLKVCSFYLMTAGFLLSLMSYSICLCSGTAAS